MVTHRPPRVLQLGACLVWVVCAENTKFRTAKPAPCKSAPIFHVDHFLSAAFSLDAACFNTLLYTRNQDLFWCSLLFGRNNLRHYMPTRVVCKSRGCQPIFGQTDLCEAPFYETSNRRFNKLLINVREQSNQDRVTLMQLSKTSVTGTKISILL